MLLWADDFRAVFWVAVVPGVIAVLVLALGVREPERHSGERAPTRSAATRCAAGAGYWWVVALGSVFTLARFSEAFLVLRAQELGVSMALVPLVMVAMNVVYAARPIPSAGWPTACPTRLLGGGLVVLIASDVLLARATGLPGLLAGVALWGIHMGMTQGLLAAMVADTAPAPLRGTAYGVFNLASGLAMLLASVVAGGLWDAFGPGATFWAGAGCSACCCWRGTRVGPAQHPELHRRLGEEDIGLGRGEGLGQPGPFVLGHHQRHLDGLVGQFEEVGRMQAAVAADARPCRRSAWRRGCPAAGRSPSATRPWAGDRGAGPRR
jgi:predicted MFS family arabinose efflux permease